MFNSVLGTIGNTPIVRLEEFEKRYSANARLYAKLEYLNPFGSIKDRSALQIIKDAEQNSLISSKTVLEATSGNLGIAIAAISQIRGYKSIIVMPENASDSRKAFLKAYSSDIILTDVDKGMLGAIEKAKEIQYTTNAFYCDQFNNFSSIKAHYLYTSREIDKQMKGSVDMIICGIGSGGTISGIASYFYERKKSVKIVGVLPKSYPHSIQGIGAGFTSSILDIEKIDEICYVSDFDALKYQKLLLKSSSIFVGISSGAVLAACMNILANGNFKDKNILMIFADGGERYI